VVQTTIPRNPITIVEILRRPSKPVPDLGNESARLAPVSVKRRHTARPNITEANNVQISSKLLVRVKEATGSSMIIAAFLSFYRLRPPLASRRFSPQACQNAA
jgi:hypothetical protein